MSTGGWSGSDDALRYFIVGGQGGPGGTGGTGGGQGGSSVVTDWVTANGTAVTVGGTTLYDLSGAATS